ncbi:hypothetical protein ACOMHN_027194 [Nucella lapillus]
MDKFVKLPDIERTIQEFVFDRTNEKVRLNLGTEGQVAIETVSPHGSTMLGVFWIRVLQHPNNYPVYRYPYKKLYKASGKHLVSLRVDTVTITVCLATGRVVISGTLALDWFAQRLGDVMRVYIKFPVLGGQALKEPFDAEERLYLKKCRKQLRDKTLEDWPEVVVEKDLDVLKAREILEEQKEDAGQLNELTDLPTYPLLGEKPIEAYHLDNLLSSSALEKHLSRLKEGAMTDGATLYAVWTGLLNRWFADPDTKVFIITSAIDAPSLERLCHVVLNHRLTASLEMLATPLRSHCGKLADIRREVMLTFPVKDRVFAEYKVYNSMVYPGTPFQAKFVAGLRGDSVQVLLTSADAERKHFQEGHACTAVFQVMSASEFDCRFLAPIVASVY